jgi:acetolactate synthase I/II/III large subunit
MPMLPLTSPGLSQKTAVNFAPVNHAAIAEACGCNGVRIEDPAHLAGTLEAARASSKTKLIEVMTDENAYLPITAFSPQETA